MINFISQANSYSQFGRLLTVPELIERRRNSLGKTLILWGYIIVSKQKPYKVTDIPTSMNFRSDKGIRDFVLKKPGTKYQRYIAFTRKEKLLKFLEKAPYCTNLPRFTPDKSTFFTEIYD